MSLQATTGQRQRSLVIPLLRKNAGEFVFGSVNKKVRTNYKKLVRELRMRFRTVESERGYRLKWTELRQSPGQSVEELAAHIKWLHDKAYPNRDRKTRKEYLVSKFFEALSDSMTKAQVQFIKDPQDIDEAVEYVVNYKDTYKSRHADGRIRATKTATEVGDSGDDESVSGDVPQKKQKTDTTKSASTKNESSNQSNGNKRSGREGCNRVAKADMKCFTCGGLGHVKQEYPTKADDKKRVWGPCYNCGQMGHIAKYCRNESQSHASNTQNGQQVVQQVVQQGWPGTSLSGGTEQASSSGSGERLGSQQQGAN